MNFKKMSQAGTRIRMNLDYTQQTSTSIDNPKLPVALPVAPVVLCRGSQMFPGMCRTSPRHLRRVMRGMRLLAPWIQPTKPKASTGWRSWV